jgi:hypothetical protein
MQNYKYQDIKENSTGCKNRETMAEYILKNVEGG